MKFNNILKKIFGNKADKDKRLFQPRVDEVKVKYETVVGLSNDELRAETDKLRKIIAEHIIEEKDKIEQLKGIINDEKLGFDEKEEYYIQIDKTEAVIDKKLEEILAEILPMAFAVMKETARRFFENKTVQVTANNFDRDLAATRPHVEIKGSTAVFHNSWEAGGTQIEWNMIHYDVQLFGGVVLHEGRIAEMATGEGKTLVATLPVFLNALTGRGVHIVTVNDYLAKRDSEWMGPLYEFHGLSVDCIDKHKPNSEQRRKAYQADITFGTNNEFGFDYLRDNMAFSPEDLVQRPHNYTIIDEVDSVLIDDARTPLIISGQVARGDKQQFDEMKGRVLKLVTAQKRLVGDLLIKAKQKFKSTDKKEHKEASFFLLQAFKGFPKSKAIIKFLSTPGTKSQMLKTEDIYLAENAKRMPEVTDDLYFVIDEKNNSIELTDKGIDLITSNSDDNNFFVLPDIGSEMAEIENADLSVSEQLVQKDKLRTDYAIKSERIHTVNQLLKAYAMFEKDVEYVVIDNKVKIVDEQTGRIMDGRRYSDGLHQAIEAKEGVKIEAATQTVATITLQNYFRMYKKLAGMTGTAETEAGELWDIYELDVVVIPTNKPIVRDDKQDLVYKTRREKYNAVASEIEDLIGKGRPVLVGTTSVDISELLSRMLKMKGIAHNILNAKLHQREADIVAEAGKNGTVTIATNMAGRGTDIKLSDKVKANGGLAIIGTERHESRRVDRQLRGRSGRQGDPGSSQFFVSLEDNLMRMFGSDRISKVMDRLGLDDGEVIQHSMISKSIERAQKKVEENNFGIRKRLLEYDDVMNSQREVIYRQRRHALYGERIDVDIANMMNDVCASIVDEYHGGSFDDFKFELLRTLSVESVISEEEFKSLSANEIIDHLYSKTVSTYKRKAQAIANQAFPVVKEVYEHSSHIYKDIVIPISDGSRIFQVPTNLKKAYETEGLDVMQSFEKAIILKTIDESWKEHLREMDELKQSVQNASYEQKDPLLIYKFESFELFRKMLNENGKGVISELMKAHIPQRDPSQIKEAKQPKRLDMSKYRTKKDDYQNTSGGGEQEKQKVQTIRKDKKIGRNAPCPCGSGKKYKNCHGK